MKRSTAAVGLLCLAACAPAAPAQAAGPEAAPTQWTTAEPGSAEGEYAHPDRRRMDEARRRGVLDQLCRKLRLRVKVDVGGGRFPQATAAMARRMEADLDNSLVLIDEETVKGGWTPSFDRSLGDGTGSLYFGAEISGKSVVVRRLGTFNSCAEVDRLFNLFDVKLVLPATAERIAAMGMGELWRLPLAVHVGYGLELSAPAGPSLTVTLGFGKDKDGAASMTLWRLSERQARFRFRLDYVQVYSQSLGVKASFEPLEFAIDGASILTRFLDKKAAKELHRYTAARMGLHAAKSDGRHLVLEYVIDPTDPAQAQAMADALRGNLATLLSYAGRMATSLTTPEETLQAYGDLELANTGRLGAPTYAARADSRARARSFELNLPFLVHRTVEESLGLDSVTRFTGGPAVFGIHSAARAPHDEYFRVPFLGPLVKDLETLAVDVVTDAPAGRPAGGPILVYIDSHAFLRLPLSSVARTVAEANAVLRLAGAARRGGPDPTLELPARAFLPPPAAAPGPAGPERPPSDEKGWTSLTLVLNGNAVRAALAASTRQVLAAFALAVPVADRPLAAWLADNGRYEGGRLLYDEARAKAELGFRPLDDGPRWLAKLAGEAAGLAEDLAEAARAAGPEERARLLARAFSYRSRSGLGHREVLRVLVQFIDPLDLTGHFILASDGTTRRAARMRAQYQLKAGRVEVPSLRAAGELRARFRDESVLTD